MNLKGKSILITGGASGLGLESAKQFLDKGASVIICGRNQAKLDQAKKLLPTVKIINCDIADPESAAQLYNQVYETGGIDILYNNAGVGTQPLNLAVTNEQHLKDAAYEMDVNYIAVIRLNNLFMDMLKSRKEAAIINTTSVLAYLPSILAPTYSATKAALHFYTRSLRVHLNIINSTVKVFELLPPLVDTDMTRGLDEKKMTSENVIRALVAGIESNKFTIRVGPAKFLYIMNRFFPKLAFSMLNQKKHYTLLQ